MARAPRTQQREDQDVRRDQILEEAIRIVGERGYYGFTVQELAQRCGISNAGLLYHFGSKDQLLLEMLQEFERREGDAISELAKRAERESKRGGLSTTAVLELLRTMALRGTTQPEIGRLHLVLLSETLDPGHPAHALYKKRQAKMLAFFSNLISPHADAPRSTARLLVAIADGLALQWVREEAGFNFVTEWDRAILALVPGLAPRRRKN
jgi:AcrR family transcriptional regulator